MAPRLLLTVLALSLVSGEALAAVYEGRTSQEQPISITVTHHRVRLVHLHLLDGCGTTDKPLDTGPISVRVKADGRFTVAFDSGYRFRLVGRLVGRSIRNGAFRLRAPGSQAGQTCDSGRVTYRARR